jgi:hypothetical protein
MKERRIMWTAIVIAVGVLQGWDSGVLRSTAGVQALVALAIAALAVAVALTRNHAIQAFTVVAAFVLLAVARVVAPTPLPTLHLIAFVPALIVLLRFTRRQSATV